VSDYVLSTTETSAVVATAYVREEIDTPLVIASQSASAVCQWGLVSVGIAFSNAPTTPTILPSPQMAYSTVSGGNFAGRNLMPVTATAIVQQSNTVTPPSPPGAQLSFYWG
jgi:hypothetical protein